MSQLFARDIFRQLDTDFAHDNVDNFVGNDMSKKSLCTNTLIHRLHVIVK